MRSVTSSILIYFAVFLASCGAGKTDDNVIVDTPKTTSVLEFKYIERYADLQADSLFFEGVWESECVGVGSVNSKKSTYAFYLDGFFIEEPLYDDRICVDKSSRNHSMQFGRIISYLPIALTNGSQNIEVQEVTFNVKTNDPVRGRPLRVNEVNWDMLFNEHLEMKAYRIIANRLYITQDYNPSSNGFLSGSTSIFLRNKAIDIGTLTESDIDVMAEQIFGVP
ncbi:MAG: hypothetical protein OEM38_10040 [Gammaproteobacteria bacterium]|nr:hypothetical protein [Gammaproteobacteria bacterium]